MTEDLSTDKPNYTDSLKSILSLAFAACLCALLLKGIAVVVSATTGKGSGFDEAAELLFHYPQSIRSIFAFFGAVIFMWCMPVIFYPSDLGEWLRKAVVIPSLHIVEHMLTLALGVLMAWLVVQLLSGDSIDLSSALKFVLICGFIVGLATATSILATFTKVEFERVARKIPQKYRLPGFIGISAILVVAVFIDFVWRYKPLVAAAH